VDEFEREEEREEEEVADEIPCSQVSISPSRLSISSPQISVDVCLFDWGVTAKESNLAAGAEEEEDDWVVCGGMFDTEREASVDRGAVATNGIVDVDEDELDEEEEEEVVDGPTVSADTEDADVFRTTENPFSFFSRSKRSEHPFILEWGWRDKFKILALSAKKGSIGTRATTGDLERRETVWGNVPSLPLPPSFSSSIFRIFEFRQQSVGGHIHFLFSTPDASGSK
jgi:hypothetical protein